MKTNQRTPDHAAREASDTIILNAEFNHRIVRGSYGYQLYGYFGYEGEFTSEMEARRAYRDNGKEPSHLSC